MDIKRAGLSFCIAALVPGAFSVIMGNSSPDFISNIMLFAIFYFVSLVVVSFVGFVVLFIALSVKFGPTLLPPLIGGLCGFLIAKVTYNAGTPMHNQWWLVIDGIVTGVVAALIYFRPWSKSVSV